MRLILALAAFPLLSFQPSAQQPAIEKVLVGGQVVSVLDGVPLPCGTVVLSLKPVV